MEERESKVTVGQVANTAINIFTNDCVGTARKNWSESQVDMLERLFESVKRGCEYKCVRCTYYGKPSDAPETVEEGCLWDMRHEEECRPCEEE